MTGWFVLAAIVLLVAAYQAVKHWRLAIAIAIICPILVVVYFVMQVVTSASRT